jgi:site-specific DNA-methyltransferase (adenine-specific)
MEDKLKDIELMHGDCLEKMKEIKDKSIDMILCDLPYGTTACKWDSIIPLELLWKEYNRIIKDGGAIVLFGSNPFSSMLISSNIKAYKHQWIWNKKSAGNILVAKYQPLKIYEDIIVFSKDKVKYYPIFTENQEDRTKEKPVQKKTDLFSGLKSGEFKPGNNKKGTQRYPKNILEFSAQSGECANSKRLHPTQKPVALLEYLIKTYTNEGETILDNCMGSGSTGEACLKTNRKFIGIEKDDNYFDIAVNRINGYIYKLR